MATIRESKNYGLFEMMELNRDVKRTTALEQSMRKYGWLDAYPAHVIQDSRGKLRVKAGHHRCTVAQKLGLAIKYVICADDGVSIHELERATRRWDIQDYLESFCRAGKGDYLTVKRLSSETGISIVLTASMLMGQTASSGNFKDSFYAGRYKVKDTIHFDAVASIVKAMKDSGVEGWNANYLVVALSKAMFVKEFDPEVFKRKIAIWPQRLRRQVSVMEYLKNIEAVYNWKNSEKVNVAFLAEEAAKARQKGFYMKKPAGHRKAA